MGSFSITIEGEPVAKSRPRHTKTGRVFTPKKTKDAEAKIARAIKLKWPRDNPKPIIGPIRVDMEFYLKIPIGTSKKKRLQLEGEPCLKTPDADNLAKLFLDAGNHSGIWGDDAQVADLSVLKAWTNEPRTFAQISWDDSMQEKK